MAGTRRPLGPALVTLIVVDAVLVLTFFAILAQAFRSDLGRLPGAAANPAASLAPTATRTEPDASGELVTFTLPSRNITCTIAPDGTSCEIAQFSYAPPVLEDCEGSAGSEVKLTPDGAAWVCREGSAPGRAGPDVAVLDYGQRISAHSYRCASAEQGVTCEYAETGRSFSLSRGGATLN